MQMMSKPLDETKKVYSTVMLCWLISDIGFYTF
jgi:hypothetical protein